MQEMIIFRVVADGRYVGITIANDVDVATLQATKGLSRHTASKDAEFCDYSTVVVIPFSNECKTPDPTKSMTSTPQQFIPKANLRL